MADDNKDGFGSSEAGKKGGDERAKRLSDSEKIAIARKAALARWSKGKDSASLPKAICGGKDPLKIGLLEIPCYVLEAGAVSIEEDRRVITVSGFQNVIGFSSSGGAPRLAAFAEAVASNSHAAKHLSARLESPIEFVLPGGGLAKGYSALLLGDLCDVILEARKQGNITERYKHIADAAETLIRGLANVGIIALIDEATGFQKIRKRLALADLLDSYLADKLNPWTKTFPDEYYIQLFRLKGWDFSRLEAGDSKPAEVGQITRRIVYRRLAPGMVQHLEEVNPYVAGAKRIFKHHQWLSEDIGHPALKEHLTTIITTMKLSDDWIHFERNLSKVLPLPDEQGWFDTFFDEKD